MLLRVFVPVSGFVGGPSAKIPCLDEEAEGKKAMCQQSFKVKVPNTIPNP